MPYSGLIIFLINAGGHAKIHNQARILEVPTPCIMILGFLLAVRVTYWRHVPSYDKLTLCPIVVIAIKSNSEFVNTCWRRRGTNNTWTPYTVENRSTASLTPPAVLLALDMHSCSFESR